MGWVTDRPDMSSAVKCGHKAKKQTNISFIKYSLAKITYPNSCYTHVSPLLSILSSVLQIFLENCLSFGNFQKNGTKHIYPYNTHKKGSLHNIFVQEDVFYIKVICHQISSKSTKK